MFAPPAAVEPHQPGYPIRFQHLANPPPRLYVRGGVPEGPAVAVVGSRAADRPGQAWAGKVAGQLARAGVTVVSGGALGIDQAAHLGALEGGGATVMVVACGIDYDYPRGSQVLRERVAEAGALLSVYPPGTPPRPQQFRVRNRLLVALAEVVVVVQGGDRSGAMSIAAEARAQGRPVLAVPGPPGGPLSKGPHQLLRDGALLAEDVDDVLKALGVGPESSPGRDQHGPRCCMSPAMADVLRWLDQGPASADELARGLGQRVGEIRATLVELEVGGLVTSHGGWYERACEGPWPSLRP